MDIGIIHYSHIATEYTTIALIANPISFVLNNLYMQNTYARLVCSSWLMVDGACDKWQSH